MYVFYTLSKCEVAIAQQWYNSALQTESMELWFLLWGIWNSQYGHSISLCILQCSVKTQCRLPPMFVTVLCTIDQFKALLSTIKPLFYLPFLIILQDRQVQLLYEISSSVVHKWWDLLWDLLLEGIECDPSFAQSAKYFTDLTETSPTAGKSVHGGKKQNFPWDYLCNILYRI